MRQVDALLVEIPYGVTEMFYASVILGQQRSVQDFEDRREQVLIDEVDKQGTSKISKLEGNVAQFPMPIYTPGDKSS